MRNLSKFRILYLLIFVVVLFILGTGATYAYWTATTKSADESIKTGSTKFSINMDLVPLYNDFSFIPMDDKNAVKALKRECKDKYGRGACSAYKIKVYDFADNLGFISGYMDITTNNMSNLSYMVFRESDTYNEDICVTIDEVNYCVVQEAVHMGDGVGLSLGEKYDVYGMDSTEFILLIWLTNLSVNQNAIDIGSFSAVVTMQAGDGGKIKGVISSAVIPNESIPDDDGTSEGGTDTEEETEGTNG